jgi:DnaJ-domain-containing protein 1
MPKINLKPRSPEFDDQKKKPRTKACDMPGCLDHGEFRAPKDRSLSDHYWFCFEHVRDYNRAWDFFSGMHPAEVEEHILNSLYGDRPTRRYDVDGAMHESLRTQAYKTYNFTDKEPPKEEPRARPTYATNNSPEFEAMALFGLAPPLDLAMIKTRYKELAKKHHPDLNPGDKQAEELLKQINMAYTILKLSFAKFEKLAAKTA